MIPPSLYFSYITESSTITINLLTLATIISTLDESSSLKHLLLPVLFSSKHFSTATKVIFLNCRCDHVSALLKGLCWLLGSSGWNLDSLMWPE